MSKVKEMSNDRLEFMLKKFGKDVSVNMFSRGMVESGIRKELNKYDDEQLGAFVKKYL